MNKEFSNIYYDQFSHLNRNDHFLKRYLKLVVIFKERNLIKNDGLNNHHIFPRSFGGLDDDTNMVYCTEKEHYILHHLLWKAFSDTGMTYAFYKMSFSKKLNMRVSAKVYEQLRYDNSNNYNKKESIRKSALGNTGLITISFGEIEKHIKPELLQEYLDKGWERKGKSKRKNFNRKDKGFIWINNDLTQTRIKPELLQEHLELGWKTGRLSHLRDAFKNVSKGRIWINNGSVNKRILPSESQKYLDLGWEFKKIPHSISKKKNINLLF